MNLHKRPPSSDKEKVVDPLLDKHLKVWPEKVKRKRTLKVLSESLDKNAGCCLKKSAMGRDVVAKPLEMMRGSMCLKEHLGKFVKCPESVRKKRSFSYSNHFSKTPGELTSQSSHSLPEEVVEEILSRLPVKSLVRFRCVCKSWHHLTYIERFVSLHLKNYSTSQLIVGNCHADTTICRMYFLPPPPPIGGYSDSDAASQKIEKDEFPRLFGGSCNGIVCLYSDCAHEPVVLWNPATNEAKNVGKKGYPRSTGLCAVGFGFDPKTNDYKILQMVYGDTPVAHMELYSMRKGSWKNVDSHDFMMACGFWPDNVICSLPFTDNRIICVIVSPLSGTSKWEILCFDMSTDMYEIISVSPTLDAELGDYEHNGSRNGCFKVFPFKETIALGIVHTIENIGNFGTYCDVWVLNGFKSSAQSRSWSKILSTNVTDGSNMPTGCWGRSQILFQEFSSDRLASLDLGNNTLVDLGLILPAWVAIGEYKESLVRIDDTKEAEDSKCL